MAFDAVLLLGALHGAWALRQARPVELPRQVGNSRAGHTWSGEGFEVHMDAQGHETFTTRPSPKLPSENCTGRTWWFHPPKTGTSFLRSVQRCEWGENRTDEIHQPLPVVASDELLKTVVGIFREPEERLCSSHAWIKKFPLCCTEDWGWTESVYNKTKQDIRHGVPAPEALGHFQGCYTNMILGAAGCMSQHEPTPEEMREALRRVGLFQFVGLTEEWTLSICLFNFLMEGRRFVTTAQLHNMRPTKGASIFRYNTTGMLKDPWDGQIYEAVQRRFWSEVREHGISLEACPVQDAGQPPEFVK